VPLLKASMQLKKGFKGRVNIITWHLFKNVNNEPKTRGPCRTDRKTRIFVYSSSVF